MPCSSPASLTRVRRRLRLPDQRSSSSVRISIQSMPAPSGNVWGGILLLSTGWRNDPVHSEIFHHLPVVIVGVGHRIHCELNARVLLTRCGACRKDRSHGVFRRNIAVAWYSAVNHNSSNRDLAHARIAGRQLTCWRFSAVPRM